MGIERLEDRRLLAGGTAAAPQGIPYVQDFSAGQPGAAAGWEYYSTGFGRIQAASGQLRFDDRKADNAYSLNEAILHVNLRDVRNVYLTLDQISSGDEFQRFAGAQFAGHVNADLIALSVDGQQWVKLSDLTSSFTGRAFALDSALQQAATAAGVADRSDVRLKFQQYDNWPWPSDGRALDNVRVAVLTQPEIEVLGQGLEIVDGDSTPATADGSLFDPLAMSLTAAHTFTIVNRGQDPLELTGLAPVSVEGPQAADFVVTQPPLRVLASGAATTFTIEFSPHGMGLRRATLAISSNDADEARYDFAVSGTGLEVPPVLNAAPAPGLRVKQVAPEYAGTNVYHTLYLPADWTPGRQYPVIVEYAPNKWGPSKSTGTVDDTILGFYQSGGEGFIWVTMPFINYATNPDSNATWWWGNGQPTDVQGMRLTAEYTKQNLIRILENYGGDPSRVFVTGFSRGAVATGAIGLFDDSMADIWLGFLPHSHHDIDTTRLNRVAGRASYITYGQNDGGAQTSAWAWQYLTGQGFPTQQSVIPAMPHTDTWIRDDASASSLAVRDSIRQWIAYVIAQHPGTHSISGSITDAFGQPVAGVRLQSGDTHWTYTDAAGHYTLAGLPDKTRTLTATWQNAKASLQVTLAGRDITGKDFTLLPWNPPVFVATNAAPFAAGWAEGEHSAVPAATSDLAVGMFGSASSPATADAFRESVAWLPGPLAEPAGWTAGTTLSPLQVPPGRRNLPSAGDRAAELALAGDLFDSDLDLGLLAQLSGERNAADQRPGATADRFFASLGNLA